MLMRKRPLLVGDVRAKFAKKIEPYKILLRVALIADADLYIRKKGATGQVIYEIDQAVWRAEKMYFISAVGAKVSMTEVAHASIHYLLVRKFGSELKGRPLFILLCEAIASMADLYFALESQRIFGSNDVSTTAIKRMVNTANDIYGKENSHRYILSLFRSESEQESFFKFRDGVCEMFMTFKFLYRLSRPTKKIPFKNFRTIYSFAEKRTFGAFIFSFQLGNNVMYARLHGGCVPDANDAVSVHHCLKLLKKSESFTDFLTSLGAGEALAAN